MPANCLPQLHKALRRIAPVQEARIIPKPAVRHHPVVYLPEDLWLRTLSYMDTKTLLDSCALVCHTWLDCVYQLTGKHLSFTGKRTCDQCDVQVSLFLGMIASLRMAPSIPFMDTKE